MSGLWLLGRNGVHRSTAEDPIAPSCGLRSTLPDRVVADVDRVEGRTRGMDRWLGNELLEALEDRRRVLKALPLRSHHQRNEWQLGVLAELLFRARVANQPLMRDPLVSEVGADL